MLRVWQAKANRAAVDRASKDRAEMNADVIKMQPQNPYGIRGMKGQTAEEMVDDRKKTTTRGVLHRALGISADVLPIKSDE